jgi:hypothetical protein
LLSLHTSPTLNPIYAPVQGGGGGALSGMSATRWIAELDVCLTDALLQSRPEATE